MALNEVGLNTDGSACPVPHSKSVNVLVPKCKNIAISVSCHEICCEVGIGRIGIGGGVGWDESKRESEVWDVK